MKVDESGGGESSAMPKKPREWPVIEVGDDDVVDCCGDGSVLKKTKKAARARHVKNPVAGDECTVHKRGWLAAEACADGEFEDSKEGGEPYSFLVEGGGEGSRAADVAKPLPPTAELQA